MQSTAEVKLGPVLIRVNWFVVAGIVLTAMGLIRLGIWQLDRASEKMALQAAMQHWDAIANSEPKQLQAGFEQTVKFLGKAAQAKGISLE